MLVVGDRPKLFKYQNKSKLVLPDLSIHNGLLY